MRAGRLLSILLLLQVRERITASDLARQLEVSERTVYRDMEALSAAGVPVYAERGHGGGWSLLDTYRTDLTGLNKAEIEALFLKPSGLLGDLGLDKAAERALIKLLAALPSVSRRDAEYVRQRIHVDGVGWFHPGEDVSRLPMLQEAIWQEHKLRLIYERSDGTVVERLVDPLGLVVKGRIWYLIAAVESQMRTYRVSRVQEARVTDQPCVRPEGFDLAAYWEESMVRFKADLPRYPAAIRAAPGSLPKLRQLRYTQIKDVGPPDAKGWVTIAMQFETIDEACERVLSLGPNIEVLEPQELRHRVIGMLERTVAIYAEPGEQIGRL